MSLPRVFDALELVAFCVVSSRHSEEQGEFEETCSERVVSARKRTARRELISMEGMMSFGSGQVSGCVFFETPFAESWVCFGREGYGRSWGRNSRNLLWFVEGEGNLET
jgi:hypothetical protein